MMLLLLKEIEELKQKAKNDLRVFEASFERKRSDLTTEKGERKTCQRELESAKRELTKRKLIENENDILHRTKKDTEGGEIALLRKMNEQLRDQVKMLEDENMTKSQTYRKSVLRESIGRIKNSRSESVKGGKTNKKIKSKRRHTKKRF